MTIRINLALQGGGSHGAFTWGVLDRLLEDEGIEIAAISGTSAGALNGAALKAGMLTGGRAGAKASLAQLWDSVGVMGDMRMASWVHNYVPFAAAASEFWEAAFPISPQGIAAQIISPYTFDALYRNPLDRLVRRFDFSKVCADEGPMLFIGATNVRTGRIKIFTGDQITPAALLASTCLPTVFQAVEIVDPETGVEEAYWDGGYTGNPALFPLYDPSLPDDIVVVSINPFHRAEIPKTAIDIQERINEVSFHASLLADLRAAAFVKRLIAEGRMPKGAMKDVLVHLIADEELMTSLGASSKMMASQPFLAKMRRAGWRAADKFLRKFRDKLNHEGTADLKGLFG